MRYLAKLSTPVTAIWRYSQVLKRTTHYAREVLRNQKKSSGLVNEQVHRTMKNWSQEMLHILGIEVTKIGETTQEPVILVGNHVSYLDIPIIMNLTPVIFIAKQQVAKWPIFGTACKSVGTILVNRDSKNSRQDAGASIAPCLRDRQQSIAVFPSSTTTTDESKPWKRGVFRIAHEGKFKVQPFRIRYQPLRLAAYLKEDLFMIHLWKIITGPKLKVTVEFQAPRFITDPETECERLWQWSREGL